MSTHDPLRFVTAADAVVEPSPWGPHEWLSRAGLTAAEQLLLVRVTMPPGKGHAFHRHPAMEEIIYVVSGRAEQWVDRESRTLGPGDIAHIPTDVVHGTYNAGDDDARVPRHPVAGRVRGAGARRRVRRGALGLAPRAAAPR